MVQFTVISISITNRKKNCRKLCTHHLKNDINAEEKSTNEKKKKRVTPLPQESMYDNQKRYQKVNLLEIIHHTKTSIFSLPLKRELKMENKDEEDTLLS